MPPPFNDSPSHSHAPVASPSAAAASVSSPPAVPWAPAPGVKFTSTHTASQQSGLGGSQPHRAAPSSSTLKQQQDRGAALPLASASSPVFLGGMGRPYNPANNSVGAGSCIGQCITVKPAVCTYTARLRQHTSAEEVLALRALPRAYDPFRSSTPLHAPGTAQPQQDAGRRHTAGAAAAGGGRGDRSQLSTPSRPGTAAVDPSGPRDAGAPSDPLLLLASHTLAAMQAAPAQGSRPVTAASVHLHAPGSRPATSSSRPATSSSSQRHALGSRPATSSSSQRHALGSRPATSSSSQHHALGSTPATSTLLSSVPHLAAALHLPGTRGPRPLTAADLAAAQVAPRPQARSSRRNKGSLSNLLDDGSCSRAMVLLPPAALLGLHAMEQVYWKNTWQPRLKELDMELGHNLVPGLSSGAKLVGGEWRCLQPKC